jgi:MSHA biogenesis protein MshO
MRSKAQGFSLIELILVIVIIGVLAVTTTQIITLPTESYINLSRRAALVDIAEMTLRRMQRDIRKALPNSIRITGGGTVIELLHTVDGGRYRAAGTGDVLDFTSTDNSFDVIGVLQNLTEIDAVNDQLVIYNLGSGNSQSDAYQSINNNRTTLTDVSPLCALPPSSPPPSPPCRLSFVSKKFPYRSPQQRFYIVDTPITYRCDTGNNQLLHYDNYGFSTNQPNPPSVAGKLLANHVASCAFTYTAGTGSRSGLVTLEITLTDEASESVKLINQIHVDNVS